MFLQVILSWNPHTHPYQQLGQIELKKREKMMQWKKSICWKYNNQLTLFLPVKLNALAVPTVFAPAVTCGKVLLLAVDTANAILNAEGVLLRTHRLIGARAVAVVLAALPSHATNGMARRLAESGYWEQEIGNTHLSSSSQKVRLTHPRVGTWTEQAPWPLGWFPNHRLPSGTHRSSAWPTRRCQDRPGCPSRSRGYPTRSRSTHSRCSHHTHLEQYEAK